LTESGRKSSGIALDRMLKNKDGADANNCTTESKKDNNDDKSK
jgi:hypothetical protein